VFRQVHLGASGTLQDAAWLRVAERPVSADVGQMIAAEFMADCDVNNQVAVTTQVDVLELKTQALPRPAPSRPPLAHLVDPRRLPVLVLPSLPPLTLPCRCSPPSHTPPSLTPPPPPPDSIYVAAEQDELPISPRPLQN